MVLSKEELYNINGGGIKFGVYAAIGCFITFIVGIVDGFLRPLSCNR